MPPLLSLARLAETLDREMDTQSVMEPGDRYVWLRPGGAGDASVGTLIMYVPDPDVAGRTWLGIYHRSCQIALLDAATVPFEVALAMVRAVLEYQIQEELS